jgi:hypothetical protein
MVGTAELCRAANALTTLRKDWGGLRGFREFGWGRGGKRRRLIVTSAHPLSFDIHPSYN